MEGDAADELDIEVDHFPCDGLVTDAEGVTGEAAGTVFDDGEGFREDFIEVGLNVLEVLEIGEVCFPLGGFLTENGFRLGLEILFDLVDLLDDGPEFLEFTLVFRTDDLAEDPVQHGAALSGG
jgi:hypothetical protein